MSNQPEKGDGSRRRVQSEGQVALSPWHYGSQEDLKEIKTNLVAEVNVIGSRYAKEPNSEDASKLIRFFHGYHLKYVELLSRGVISRDGKRVPSDTRRFLALFRLTSADRTRPMGMAEMQAIASRIPNAFIMMSPDDIYNELVVMFLELARKFDTDIGGFTGYIGYHFKYALKQKMFQVQRDALNYQPLFEPGLEDNELDSLEETEEVSSDEEGYQDASFRLLESIGLKSLNHSFVSTPPEHLDRFLSKIQRKILVLHFCDGQSFSQIAKTLNYGNATAAKNEYDKAIETLQIIADVDVLGGQNA